MTHPCEPSLKVLRERRSELLRGEVTAEDEKRFGAIEKQIERREHEAQMEDQ